MGRVVHSFPFPAQLKLSVGDTIVPDPLETEGLLTQGLRGGRTVGEPVGGILELDSSDWSNGIRYHIFDTRPDSGFNCLSVYGQSVTICANSQTNGVRPCRGADRGGGHGERRPQASQRLASEFGASQEANIGHLEPPQLHRQRFRFRFLLLGGAVQVDPIKPTL